MLSIFVRNGGDGGDTPIAARTGDAGGGEEFCSCATGGGELVVAVRSNSLVVVVDVALLVVLVLVVLVVGVEVLLELLSTGVVISTGRIDSCRRDEVRGEDGAFLCATSGEKLFFDMIDFSQRSYIFFFNSIHCLKCFSFNSFVATAAAAAIVSFASSSFVAVVSLPAAADVVEEIFFISRLVLAFETDCCATKLTRRLLDMQWYLFGISCF